MDERHPPTQVAQVYKDLKSMWGFIPTGRLLNLTGNLFNRQNDTQFASERNPRMRKGSEIDSLN